MVKLPEHSSFSFMKGINQTDGLLGLGATDKDNFVQIAATMGQVND